MNELTAAKILLFAYGSDGSIWRRPRNSAWRFLRANPEGTIQFLVERQKIDRELAAATYDGVAKAFNEGGSVPEKGLRLVIEETKKAAKVNRDVSISEVADLTILREAEKELGIKGK